ncbi:hypothetical protein M2399_002882 [Pseudomonas sp. BIGb0450]|uniref:lipase family protein n=1 Tax=unclassified Pseudomonas TaxID=196821 RepID=UPI00216A1199|nr:MULTISPECIES: lipase family protein [unclassified Pseudomonas]MCS3417479.1 hypothetical protein [Pseudomonas sp. BIGb0558]MCS3437440.1 hypothetical protein [Pseudomonas sp. BIGb0450]
MSDEFLHRTDTLGTVKVVTCGPQKKHWVEFQLVDEQGEPLANLPWRAVNDATRADCAPPHSGVSDAQGVVRVDGLHPIPITLLVSADPLAEQLQTRRLRAERPEPEWPIIGDRGAPYGPQRPGFSPIEAQALAAGHGYHYVRIGQLCDQAPNVDPPLADSKKLPAFHFPDPAFSGFTVEYEELNRRHVVEVCPFRAWALVLHHQPEYSLVNAHNLGLMSILAYSRYEENDRGSPEQFFLHQCLDLSRTPRVLDTGNNWGCVVTDVPFSQRYTLARTLDTGKADPPEGNTQFFYAINASQVLVAWRGTEMAWPFTDLATDVTFRPVKPEVQATCEPKVPCDDLTPQGSVHLGFRDAFEKARRIYAEGLGGTVFNAIDGKDLFICGHSLGGALGLIHASSLKDQNPLLYTYGMPRTFTLKAVQGLADIRHFRHVNDTDTIPSVPPEAELDNYLYNLYGQLGTSLGFAWSLVQLTARQLFRYGDPFCHHGEIAMLYWADQHRQARGSHYPAYLNKEGLGAPYHTTINHRLAQRSLMYVVPSLSTDDSQQAEHAQQRFFTSLTTDSRDRIFPPNGNLRTGRFTGLGNHFMGVYQPHIRNQLLELLNPGRDPLLERQVQRQKFKQQMRENALSAPEDELTRNRVFLELQNQLEQALRVTREMEGGAEALQRFDAVSDPERHHETIKG